MATPSEWAGPPVKWAGLPVSPTLPYIRVSKVCLIRPGTLVTAVASSQYDILLCSETLVSDLRHVSELLVPGFGHPLLLCLGKLPRARGMAAYVRDGYGAFRQPKFECCCCEMLVVRVCGLRQNFYVYSLYRNPDQDDRIYDC